MIFLKLIFTILLWGFFKKNTINIDNPDYYDIAQNHINKKPAFATEILYYDGETEKIEWETPAYIKEGLEWLKEQ